MLPILEVVKEIEGKWGVCVKAWYVFRGSEVCIKVGHNISHLPLSLTVGVHPPWIFAD